MTSNVVNILTQKYDEFAVNRKIESIYKSSGLNKPKILVFDTIPACKFAYRLLLTHLNNNSKNLTDEHGSIKSPNLNNEISRDLKLSLYNITKIIEKYYDNIHNGFSALPEIKSQLLKDYKPPHISKDDWNYASDKTKELNLDKVWQNTINSKANFFEFKVENYISYIFSDGILFGIFLKNFCILCKNPIKILEYKPEELHSIEGHAIEFKDGNGLYFVHNTNFEPELFSKVFIKKDLTGKEAINLKNFEQLEIILKYFDINKLVIDICAKDLTKINNIELLRKFVEVYNHDKFVKEIIGKEIIKIKNVEIRSVLIQYYGYDNLIQDLNAKLLDVKDEFNNLDNTPITNELWEFEMEIEGRGSRRDISTPRKFRFVRVEDYSTHKKVCLGVPVIEQTNTCIGAIAWTFGMTEEEYKPQVQT